jgi:hypothetical protein
MWRHKTDAAVAVPVVVQIHKCSYPFAGIVLAGKAPAGVGRPVLERSEKEF